MKGAMLLAKTDQLFPAIAVHLQSLGYSFTGGHPHAGDYKPSIVLNTSSEYKFYLYDTDREDTKAIALFDVPDALMRKGYIHVYLIECRSETLFCDIVSTIPPEVDVLVLDTDGQLFRPHEVSVESIVL
jgi:hypothetical protein